MTATLAASQTAATYRAWLTLVNICPTCGRRDDYASIDLADHRHDFMCADTLRGCGAQWFAYPGSTSVAVEKQGAVAGNLATANAFRLGYRDGRLGRSSIAAACGRFKDPYTTGYVAGVRDLALACWLDNRSEEVRS